MNGPLIQLLQGITQGDFALALSSIIVIVLLLFICFPVHEFAHAYVATRLGDDTARLMGRVTLNPFAHLDPFGSLFFLVGGFGWAKPVPVNPYRLRGDPKMMMAMVALAGPVSNILLAIFFALMFRAMYPIIGTSVDLLSGTIVQALITAVMLNLLLALFNLIPIPPLDGSRLLSALIPDEGARIMAMIERYGFLLLMVVVFAVPTVMTALITGPAARIARLLLGI
ncbi:MAG TPA: site-2 protease family protein [Anaerolineae bacterium]|jgi:Zn-dependent protease